MTKPLDALINRSQSPRKLASALMAPSSIIAAGGGAAVAIVAGMGLPFGLALGVLVGLAKMVISVNRVRTRKAPVEPIDPFRVGEPWREHVQAAQQAQIRFERSVREIRSGPLRERLAEIAKRVDEGARECFEVAKKGYALDNAVNELDLRGTRKELAAAEAEVAKNSDPTRQSALTATLESIRSRLASSERMASVAQSTKDRLRQLDAQLDELVARAIELSINASSADELGALGTDVDSVVTEMEALRQAMEETGRMGATASGPAGISQPQPG